MEILINLKDLQELKLNPSLYCYLATLFFEKPYPNASDKLKIHMNNKLEELGYAKVTTNGVELTPKAIAIFDFPIKAPSVALDDWVNSWRELFPKGIKSGGRPVRGDKQGVTKKLRQFIKLNPKVTKDQIIAATRQYVYDCSLNNYRFMTCADYFINKNGSSMLGAMVEDIVDGGSSLRNTEQGGGSSWHREI